jgi:hypothetical protein
MIRILLDSRLRGNDIFVVDMIYSLLAIYTDIVIPAQAGIQQYKTC